jgi:signal transduction histidine kinase/CheY-like chemotaxis protein
MPSAPGLEVEEVKSASLGTEGPDLGLGEFDQLRQRVHALERELVQRKELENTLRKVLLREKEAGDEAKRSVRYNEMFAGMLGHDLRNPLSAITTGANYIARMNPNEKATRAATRIFSSAERMARMIDQLLDFTRIRAGGGLVLSPGHFDLREVCYKVKSKLDAAFPGCSILLEFEGNVEGEWDHDRLLQVFVSLVGNALHHGTEGHAVKLRCDGSDPAYLSVSIHNDGIVAPEVLPILFEPFRGDTRYQRAGGLGLGLFIARQIVEAHDGTIDVISDEATGTTLRLHLPRGPLLRKHASGNPEKTSNTIVVVDDEEAICETLKDILEEEGYAVEVAGNGVEAMAVFSRMPLPPCLVILDLLMPRMDGNAVYAALKADPTLADIPVVISTSDPSRAPSGVPIMRKPVDLDALLETVRRHC